MASIYKKAMGPHQSPMASPPHMGSDLWVTLSKIKVKVIKIKTLVHDFSLSRNINHIGSGMSRGYFQSPAAPESVSLTGKCPASPALEG